MFFWAEIISPISFRPLIVTDYVPVAEQRAVCGAHERFFGWERPGSVHLHDAAEAAGCAPTFLRMRREPTIATTKTGLVPDERQRNEEM